MQQIAPSDLEGTGAVNYDAFEQQISAGRLSPVYFFHGPEEYLVRRAVRGICGAVAQRAGTEPQLQRLDAGEVTLADVLMEARSMPLFGSWRVIRVDGVERYAVGAAAGKRPRKELAGEVSAPAGAEANRTKTGPAASGSNLARLEAYLADAPRDVVLLLVTGYLRKEELRKGFYRALAPFTVECRVSSRDVTSWIHRLARERKLRLERDGVSLLREIVGEELALLESELEKLALMGTADRPLSAEMLKELLSETSRDDVYKLLNALGEANLVLSLRVLKNLLAARSEATWIVASVYNHFHQLAVARELREAGLRNNEIAGRIGISSYFLEGYLAQARHFSLEEIAGILEAIVEAEEAVKTSRLPAGAVLEGLVLRICGAYASGGRQS